MVHFAFITLLALTAINSGESTSKDAISTRLAKINREIPKVTAYLKSSEAKVKQATDKILSQNASLQGEIKKYTDCLENAYKYSWGSEAFKNILHHFPGDPHRILVDAAKCIQQESFEYKRNIEEFPIKKCFVNMPPAPYEDLRQLNVQIYYLFFHKHEQTFNIYAKNINEILLKGLIFMKHKLPTCVSPSFSKLRRLDGGCSQVEKTNSVNSLLDLSAKVVAEFLPFEYVERMLVHVPEPVQEKIIYYSFPQRDSDIYTYASFHTKYDKTRDKIPYYQGLEYFQNNCVEDVIQIGFHLTGSVRQQPASCVVGTQGGNKFKVSITFDRCKIISVCCDCGNKGLPWCPHVVALAIFRIRQPQSVDYRSPISDALVCMSRSQLQKFAQYLIASHPNKILPSAQRLADQLLQPESTINKTSGAPDPTAGGSLQEVAAWYLDEAGVREQLRAELTNLANNATLVGGLYGGDNNSPPNIRLPSGGGGGQSGAQLSASAPPSGVMQQRSNNSHRPHPNSSSSLDNNNNNNSRVVNNRNQSDTDHTSSPPPPPSEEVGLDWLLRYRRLTTSHQNLFIGSTTCTNPYTTFNDFDFASSSTSSNHAPGSYDESCLHSESSMSNNNNNSSNRLYYSTSPFHLLSNSFDIDPNVHNNSNINTTNTTTTTTNSSSMQSSGTQIAAMFAKVRELLAKRDSNAPRLLSLITEELLNCSKLPPLKSRRNIRNSGINMANRSQTIPPVIRLPHSQLLQTSDRNYSSENLSNSSSSAPSPSSNHNSSHSLFSQPPPWTVRLWEEVCLLWTLVLLSPDCSAEVKKQWRCRLQNWSRVSRSPCDDCYLLPNHYFSSIHELSEVDEVDGQQHQQQSGGQQPATSRAYRRTSVFRLPIEVSYMSWDEVWLTHLLSFNNNNNNIKSDKNEEELNETSVNRQSHYSTNISLDDNNNNKTTSNSPGAGGGGECHCPYCDLSATLTEPFPLLCLRVAALRSNGYLSQALQLAVFISQRLLRSVKAKTALATSTLFNMGMRSPPQTFSPHMSWNNNNNNSNSNSNNNNSNNNNNNYPNDILTARRTLFNTPPNNGQGIRVGGGMHSNSRYISSANMPSSPIIISNHGKFSPSHRRLTSPRPASLSPPINVNHHSRSIPPPPPPPLPAPRRLGLSPNSNHSPGPSCSNHQPVNNNNNCCWSSQSPYLFKSPPPPPPSAPSTSQQYLNHCSPSASAPSASSSSSGSSPFSPVPFHNSYHHHHQQQQQQSSNTNHVYYYYNKQHMPYPNSSLYPYASSCSLPPPMHNSNCGSNGNSIGAAATAAVMHPVHYNRSLTSPTSPCPPPPPPGNRSIPSRPLLSPHSNMPSGGGGDYFPGRPVICLVECLLDAAAIVVEAAASHHHHHQTPIALPSSWGHMEKASFYLCLAVKVSGYP
ncbi:unnamed protein product [Trichobilharzia szidati]|nr:unnamed protein product [Trichobilharzia szidati]